MKHHMTKYTYVVVGVPKDHSGIRSLFPRSKNYLTEKGVLSAKERMKKDPKFSSVEVWIEAK